MTNCSVRRADPVRDNAALCALARRCPQGQRLRFYHHRDDCRERLRRHADAEILVVEEGGILRAAGAVARKRMWLSGQGLAAACVFDVMVDPDHRGRGLGHRILQALREACPQARLVYAYVLADNRASVRLFEAAGFAAHPRRLLYHTLVPRLARRRPPAGFAWQEPIDPSDAARIDAWLRQRYDFLDETAGHDALLRLEHRGGRAWAALRRLGPKVFVGVPWYYAALSRLLPVLPRMGQPVLAWSLHHLGADGPCPSAAARRLLSAVAWLAARAHIDAVTLPLFENDPWDAVLRRYTLTGWGLAPPATRLYVAGERCRDVLTSPRPLLASGRDE